VPGEGILAREALPRLPIREHRELAQEVGIAGPLLSISAYTMKHPPQQFPDNVARQMVEDFIKGERER